MPNPIVGQCYTLQDILTNLKLWDTPHLRFRWRGELLVISNSHITDEQLLSVPGISSTQWMYNGITSEWCELFTYVIGVALIVEFVDIDGDWVTPKGFPRKNPEFMSDSELLKG